MKRIFRFVFFTSADSPLLHQIRDSAIFIELEALLYSLGFFYWDSFFNYPKMHVNEHLSFNIASADLIVLTTRPPLHDKHQRKKIYRSGHVLEKKLLDLILYCFRTLSRDKLILHERLIPFLKKGYENRAAIEFYVNKTAQNISAGYQHVAEWDVIKDWIKWSTINSLNKSCAFLIFFRETDELPPVLFVFGIGGQEGLIFSRMLRNGLWNELKIDLNGPSRFIMVEFPVSIPPKPTSLDFVKALNYEVILDALL